MSLSLCHIRVGKTTYIRPRKPSCLVNKTWAYKACLGFELHQVMLFGLNRTKIWALQRHNQAFLSFIKEKVQFESINELCEQTFIRSHWRLASYLSGNIFWYNPKFRVWPKLAPALKNQGSWNFFTKGYFLFLDVCIFPSKDVEWSFCDRKWNLDCESVLRLKICVYTKS